MKRRLMFFLIIVMVSRIIFYVIRCEQFGRVYERVNSTIYFKVSEFVSSPPPFKGLGINSYLYYRL